MKKYIYKLCIAFIATATIASCSGDEGAVPGSDSKPVITVYQYKTSRPYNVDNDIIVRFATNNQTTEAYYLAEKTVDANARITSIGEEAYTDYVVANGTKLADVSGESNVDVTLIDLYGDYTITAVAVGKGIKTSAKTTFIGIDWSTVATGTYLFGTAGKKVSGVESNPTVLQVCTTDDKLYRFKDVFGSGYHLKINLINLTGTDADGEYRFFRVPVAETPYTYGTYGAVGVRDIGYWQGSDAWVTDNGYESGMYADYNCFIYIQWFVSAGNIGYNYDFFVVD
jgi:hypothetical protein